MSVDLRVPETPAPPAAEPGRRHVGRAGLGLVIVVIGVGWLLDSIGVSVPWRALPAAGLIVVGAVLVVSGRARGGLVVFGAVLLAMAALIGGTQARFVGPSGDRTVTPAVSEWPLREEMSAGRLILDLTDRALPDTGRAEVGVGVGQLQVFVPHDRPIRIDASVGVGNVLVDGRVVDDGFGPQWSDPDTLAPTIVVDARVGIGSIEVHHE